MPESAHPENNRDNPRRRDGDRREDRYDPSKVEATRARHRVLGAGERDLDRQRDPRRPAPPPGEDRRPDGD